MKTLILDENCGKWKLLMTLRHVDINGQSMSLHMISVYVIAGGAPLNIISAYSKYTLGLAGLYMLDTHVIS